MALIIEGHTPNDGKAYRRERDLTIEGLATRLHAAGLGITDNTTEGNVPVKQSGALEDSNLSQDPTGELRASTLIYAEGGVDSTPATFVSGDGVDIKSSGPAVIFQSKVTDILYQVPYQSIDKTGSGEVFTFKAGAEATNVARQPLFDIQLTSPATASRTVPKDEIINAFHFKTDGTVNNFRFKIKAIPSNNTILSFPNKFDYEKDIGVTLTGAGTHKIDLYYNYKSSPTRFINGQELEFTFQWEDDPGTVLGCSIGCPWYEVDEQEFTFDYRNKLTDEIVAALANIQTGIPDKTIPFSKDGVLASDDSLIYYATVDGVTKVIGVGDFDTVLPFTGTNSLTKGVHIRNTDGGLVLEEVDGVGDTVSMISLQAGTGKKFYIKNEVTNTEIISLDNSDVLRMPNADRVEVGNSTDGGEITILGPNTMTDMAVWSIYESSYQNNGLQFAYDSGGNCMYLYNWTGGVKNTTPIAKFCRSRNSLRVSNLELLERSSEPSNPPDGESCIWLTNGSGAGDDGDIMVKINKGGTTKTGTLVKYSTMAVI